MNRVHVGLESIRGDLKLPCVASLIFSVKATVSRGCAPSKVPSQNQLRVALDCDEAIGIPAHGIAGYVALFLASDEAPYFVTLNVLHGETLGCHFQQALAAISDKTSMFRIVSR